MRAALAEVVGWPKEFPAEWDDQLVEGRVELKSLAETRIYEPDGTRLP